MSNRPADTTSTGRGLPATTWRITTAGRRWLEEHDHAPAHAQRKTDQAQRAAAERDQALEAARATFDRQTPRISRKHAAHQLRELGATLDQIAAVGLDVGADAANFFDRLIVSAVAQRAAAQARTQTVTLRLTRRFIKPDILA